MSTEFELAIAQICEEKGLKKEDVVKTIEQALAAAFRKDYGKKGQLIETIFDPKTGATRVFDVKEVVKTEEEIEKPERQITPKQAKEMKLKKKAKAGDVIKTEVTPKEIKFGRIAAQTAKQVIMQRIREAEKNTILALYKDKIGQVLNGTIQRIENYNIFVDIGQTTGILFPQEQIRNERYSIGQRIKVYLADVKDTPRGPELVLSRSNPELVKKLFELEVPEIAAGAVEIKAIAREAGARTKIAVFTNKDEIDPIGACVGQRGTRVQTIIGELGGEKIDIISWDENPVKFISNALSPAKIISVKLNEKEKYSQVEVAPEQLSLAIGRGGQNVRLAVKLTGWRIDVAKEQSEVKPKETKPEVKSEDKAKEVKTDKSEKPVKPEKSKDVKPENKVKPDKKVKSKIKAKKTSIKPEKPKEVKPENTVKQVETKPEEVKAKKE